MESTAITRAGASTTRSADEPLTLAIDNRLNDQISVAQEVRARLYNLKDRLFGASPENSASKEAAPGYNGFSDSVREKGRTLSAMLAEIDGLTMDINNRL